MEYFIHVEFFDYAEIGRVFVYHCLNTNKKIKSLKKPKTIEQLRLIFKINEKSNIFLFNIDFISSCESRKIELLIFENSYNHFLKKTKKKWEIPPHLKEQWVPSFNYDQFLKENIKKYLNT